MSVHADRDRWKVRWRSSGQNKAKTFDSEAAARRFEEKVRRRKQNGHAAKLLHLEDLGDKDEQVYVISGGGKVKIGASVLPLDRLANLQTGSPMPLSLVWRIACPNARKLERALHRRYAAHHSHGEWFEAGPVLADLAGLARLGPCEFSRRSEPPDDDPDDPGPRAVHAGSAA